MEKDTELVKLRKEIKILRDTVSNLTKTIDDLKTKVVNDEPNVSDKAGNDYRIFQDSESCLSQDASWIRLMNLLQNTNSGLSAAEAAIKWGKSRSRTSEVLNKLADEGHLVKYRDGREIKFRTTDD